MILIIILLICFMTLCLLELCTNKTKKLLQLQKTMLADDYYLWLFMILILIIYALIIYVSPDFMNDETTKNIINGVVLSIIAALIFYIFTDFIPSSKKKLEYIQNINKNCDRVLDIYCSIQELFETDSDSLIEPKKFVEKFVIEKNKEKDEYTIDSYCAGRLDYAIPNIVKLCQSMYTRYGEQMSSKHRSNFDVLLDASFLVGVNVIKGKMTFKECEAVWLNLLSIYYTLKNLKQDIAPYVLDSNEK